MNKHVLIGLLFTATFWLGACGNKATPNNPDNTAVTATATPTPTPVADPLDAFLTAFKTAAAGSDRNAVFALMQFPQKSDMKTKEEMNGGYNFIFDDYNKSRIAACTKADWKETEIGDSKGLAFTIQFELTAEEKADGMEGATTTFMLEKVGDSYKISGIWMAG